LKELISQYADNVLDPEVTERVASLLARSPEAGAYFARLQRLRRAAGGASSEREQSSRALLDRLPHSHREILELREIEGLDYGEISRALTIPLGAVRSRLSRARERWVEDAEASAGNAEELVGCPAGGERVA